MHVYPEKKLPRLCVLATHLFLTLQFKEGVENKAACLTGLKHMCGVQLADDVGGGGEATRSLKICLSKTDSLIDPGNVFRDAESKVSKTNGI